MKHPTREEWVIYLTGETQPTERSQLAEHLGECAECKEQVQSWRRTLGRLDAWKMPAFTVRRRVQPFWRWAAAAALVVGTTFALGRFSSPASADIAKLRKEMEDSVRQSVQAETRQQNEQMKIELNAALLAIRSQLTNEYQAQMAQVIDSAVSDAMTASSRLNQRQLRELAQSLNQKLERAREQDREAALIAVNRLQSEYQSDFLVLRKDLETLASATDDQFQLAREKLIQIASAQ